MQHDHEVEVKLSEEFKEYVDGINKRLGHGKTAVKQHVKKHQTIYACGATAIVCVVGTKIFGRSTVINNNVMPSIAPVMNNIVNNTVNNGGHMRKIVRCVETDELWTSVSKAAEAAESSISKMSQHLNGHKDHVNGLHYVIEGLAAG